MNEKGQAVAVDMLIAVSLFLILIAVLVTISSNQNFSEMENLIQEDMQLEGQRALNFMVRSQGETTTGETDWESEATLDNIKFFGLAKRDRSITGEKTAKFIGYAKNSYNNTKEKMLLDYEYYARFLDREGNVIEEPKDTKMEGGKTAVNPYGIILLKRIVNFEGSEYNGEAIFELRLFRERPESYEG